MFRKAILTLGTGLALVSQPVLAQEAEEMPDLSALTAMFEVEPLTEDQQARLPLATSIIDRMIPAGTMQEMMGPMYDKMMGPLMALESEADNPADYVAENLGLDPTALALTAKQAAEIAAMFDPVRQERKAAVAEMIPSMMSEMMGIMEPGMKKAMSELYAINFSDIELAEIDTFFATNTGTSFARKSFTMASDPRIIGVSMEALPEIMGMFAGMGERIEAASADLPAERGFADLTQAERARISELTGYDENTLSETVDPQIFEDEDDSAVAEDIG